MQLARPLAAGLVGLVALCAAPAPAEAAPPKHYTDAYDLVSALIASPQNVNVYNDGSLVDHIDWAGSPRTAVSVCATFVTMLLAHSYGLTDAQFVAKTGSKSPNPLAYWNTIAKGSGFTRVTKIEQLVAGDLVAIRYPFGSTPSGHVQMVASVGPFQLKANSKQKFLATERAIYGFFDVGVIDSSSSYHGPLDTRFQKPGGIGRGGVYRVFVDVNLSVLGYTWSIAGNDYKRETAGYRQIFGRLNLAAW
jgi:hypothetical protein